jgi:bacterioferritin (cytochrome b1)
MADRPPLTDVKTLRKRARADIQRGAVTEGYRADRDNVLSLLNEALATELVCVLRVAIDSYREVIAYLGTDDPTTRRMLEGILAMEEEHAGDLVSLLEEMGDS